MTSILFIGKYQSAEQFNFFQNAVKKYFDGKNVRLKMVMFVDEKKLPEHLTQSQTVTFLCKSDLNILKKWKTDLAKLELKTKHDLLISCLFDSTKYLDAFILKSDSELKCGVDGVYDYDLSIVQETEDIEQYFIKLKKYLKKI